LNTTQPEATVTRALSHQQLAAINVVTALEAGLTSSCQGSGSSPSLTFTFVCDQHLQAACDAWRTFALASIDVAAPFAVTAAQRAAAEIGSALFDDPTLDLAAIAQRVLAARRNLPGPLLVWSCS
jgi:hypothetical protein